MNILLHTIALEPARWTPQRVSRPLSELLPTVAGAGFYKLEIFEPHLALLPDEPAMVPIFERLHLRPMVLDSHLELSPLLSTDDEFETRAAALLGRVDRFGFGKVTLSADRGPTVGEDGDTMARIGRRLRLLAGQRPSVEFLLETHDGSLADHPARPVELVRASGLPNVGLLWQPAVFEPKAAREQWRIQREHVRHIHLQNRTSDGELCRLGAGVIDWGEILASVGFQIDVTLELVPTGICDVEQFDLTTSVQESVEEFDYVVKLEN